MSTIVTDSSGVNYLLLTIICVSVFPSSRRQLEKDLTVIAAESEKEGEDGAMVS